VPAAPKPTGNLKPASPMKERDRTALKLSIGMLLLSLLSLWVCKSYLQIDISSLASLIIFIPLITFLAVSGKLGSFKFGELQATLHENVGTTIDDLDYEKILIDARNLAGQRYDAPQRLPIKPLIYSIRIKESIFSDEEQKNYDQKLKDLLRHFENRFSYRTYIAFTDRGDRLVGYMDLRLLRYKLFVSENILLDFIKSGKTYYIEELGIQTSTINKDENALETLRRMTDNNEYYIAVVDNQQKIIAILERPELTSKVLVQLIDEIEGIKIRRVKTRDDRK
jgi:hypothetical protein